MGIFFNNYENAGAGISKNAPKKKGVSLFFDIVGRKFWKLMALNLLYMLFFLPIIMMLPVMSIFKNNYEASIASMIVLLVIFAIFIGPATAGLTKVIRLFFINKHSFIARDFFSGFKSNFKRSVLIGIFDCLIIASAFAAFNVYPALAMQTESKLLYIPMIITFSLFLVIVIMNHYIFLMLAATNLSMKNIFKNSFALSFIAIKQNLLVFALVLITLILMFLLRIYLLPIFLLIMPFFPAAFICLLNCFISYPIIQKYVINPYYTSIGEVNPELVEDTPDDSERIFEDMGGKEKPIEGRKKGKGKHIS